MNEIVSITLEGRPPLTEADLAELQVLAETEPTEADLAEIPELTPEAWARATVKRATAVV